MTKDLIIARFNESLEWVRLTNLPTVDRIFIYNKGEPLDEHESVPLPNVGRESHTYTHHIIENYDSLADINCFVQGNPFHESPDLYNVLDQPSFVEMAQSKGVVSTNSLLELSYNYCHNTTKKRDDWYTNVNQQMIEIYKSLFGRPIPTVVCSPKGAQFAVTDVAIRKHPISFYEKLYQLHDMFYTPWAMEFLWGELLGDPTISLL